MDTFWDFLRASFSSIPTIFGLLGLLIGIWSVYRQRHALKKKEEDLIKLEVEKSEVRKRFEKLRFELEKSTDSDAKKGQVEVVSRLPPVPDELVEACASGSCVLWAGSGVAAQAGYPTWRETLLTLIERASASDTSADWSKLTEAVRVGRLAETEELINSRVPRQELIELARTLFARPLEALPPFCDSLATIPFAGVITPNWDNLLERAFKNYNPLIVLSSNSEAVDKLIAGDRFFIVKLYGDPTEPKTFRFTPKEYEYDLFENQTYSKFLTSWFLSRSVFFVGASLKGIDDFLSGLRLRDMPARQHFALVPREADMELQEELFLSKYGVKLISYQPTAGFPEVLAFIEKLREVLKEREPIASKVEIRDATLNHVTLKNIGIFKELDLELNKGWNILIGNNGCGKTTLLKAIALGLCGDDTKAAEAGGWLLRQGTDVGSIRLRVGEDEFLTELFREHDRVRVRCRQLTPLQRGNWVVLGFPAMRGVSSHNPSGPAGRSLSRPVVHDLLPLIEGAVDHRMDSLKQWIVNVDAWSRPSSNADEIEAKQNAQLRTMFFDLLKKVSPRKLKVEFDYVGKDFQVWIKVDDISVPMDQISQGMSSVIGWIGTLLQRMYEIYRNDNRPEYRAALVLVDEIDAHLHPEWQQLLVPLIKEVFPCLQMFATTHSPLIVAGMKSEEVWIAKRDFETETFEVISAPVEFEGMRADQILTSRAFGLVTTRSLETSDDVKLYSTLLGQKAELSEKGQPLSEQETAELRDLEERLKKLRIKLESARRIGENETQRMVERAVRKAFDELAVLGGAEGELQKSSMMPEVDHEIRRQLAEIFTHEGEGQ